MPVYLYTVNMKALTHIKVQTLYTQCECFLSFTWGSVSYMIMVKVVKTKLQY